MGAGGAFRDGMRCTSTGGASTRVTGRRPSPVVLFATTGTASPGRKGTASMVTSTTATWRGVPVSPVAGTASFGTWGMSAGEAMCTAACTTSTLGRPGASTVRLSAVVVCACRAKPVNSPIIASIRISVPYRGDDEVHAHVVGERGVVHLEADRPGAGLHMLDHHVRCGGPVAGEHHAHPGVHRNARNGGREGVERKGVHVGGRVVPEVGDRVHEP